MKKLLSLAMLLICSVTMMAQAQIKFEKTVHNFGTFSEDNGVVKCSFEFTNTGDKPLVINQAVASCGCTATNYTKKPVAPGEKGSVDITYNGVGKFPGHFKKTITIRCNGKPDSVRLYIEGDMTESTK